MKRIVTWRRSPAGRLSGAGVAGAVSIAVGAVGAAVTASIAVPQPGQNLAPAGNAAPQLKQNFGVVPVISLFRPLLAPHLC